MANASYTQVGWEDSPSTNTPINESNLGHMDQGISDAISRANASIPTDNILSKNELGALTQSGKYVADALVTKTVVTQIGNMELRNVDDSTEECGYRSERRKVGTTEWFPFSKGLERIVLVENASNGTTFTVPTDYGNNLTNDNFAYVVTRVSSVSHNPNGSAWDSYSDSAQTTCIYNPTTRVVKISGASCGSWQGSAVTSGQLVMFI